MVAAKLFSFLIFEITAAADLLLFIGVTSGPNSIIYRSTLRETWLQPCIAAKLCDYRFFIDQHKSLFSNNLQNEIVDHGDIVSREFCPYMDIHPLEVNYGNTGYQRDTKFNYNGTYYREQFRYKIDWKACFSKWCLVNNKMAKYHLYVEDDSFVNTRNILHQLEILESLKFKGTKIPDFRAGYIKPVIRDGFDDSSTLMTKNIVEAFANHYLEPHFSCDNVAQRTYNFTNPVESNLYNDSLILAWGTSWRKDMCNWSEILQNHYNITVIYPQPDCRLALRRKFNHQKCPPIPLIVHKNDPKRLMNFAKSYDQYFDKLLKSVLIMDVIKDKNLIANFHQHTVNLDNKRISNFHNFSAVFLYPNLEGWKNIIKSSNNLNDGFPHGIFELRSECN